MIKFDASFEMYQDEVAEAMELFERDYQADGWNYTTKQESYDTLHLFIITNKYVARYVSYCDERKVLDSVVVAISAVQMINSALKEL